MNTEKQLEKVIIQWLDSKGFYAVKVQSGRMLADYHGKKRAINMAPAGTPDIFCIMNSYGVCIEVKRDQAKAQEWERVAEKYRTTGACAKSNIPIIQQYECHKSIRGRNAHGIVLVVGSLRELEKKLSSLHFIA